MCSYKNTVKNKRFIDYFKGTYITISLIIKITKKRSIEILLILLVNI